MPEAEQGMNVARIASLRAGIPVQASAVTVNRFCSSGLQAIAYGAERVMCGFAETIVAGGTESEGTFPYRAALAVAERLGAETVIFPSHHGGFGQQGDPDAFAATLRRVLTDAG